MLQEMRARRLDRRARLASDGLDPAPSPNVEAFQVHRRLESGSPANPVYLTLRRPPAFVKRFGNECAGIVSQHERHRQVVTILKDAAGNPQAYCARRGQSGRAQKALSSIRATRRVRQDRESDSKNQSDLSVEECIRKGFTIFQDAEPPPEFIHALNKRVDEGRMPLCALGDGLGAEHHASDARLPHRN